MIDGVGVGVLINRLDGNRETVDTHTAMVGKVIERVYMESDVLHFVFADGYRAKAWDDGQSCCENRYMMTDDNLDDFAGATLLGLELREGSTTEDEYETHETQFLLVNTSIGTFTMCTHNEHNGYYGGFTVELREEAD